MLATVSIEIFGKSDIEKLRAAGRAAAEVVAALEARVEPGVTTADLDRWARKEIGQRSGRSSVLGYHGFPAAICTSRNHVVCHGIPSDGDRLHHGDIVNIDVTTEVNGFHGDTSRTIFVGEPTAEAKHVVEVAKRCLAAGIRTVRDGAWIGDIGAAVEDLADREGCSVVRELGGHGIGRTMHCAPHVSHVGERGTGTRLRAGMALTIEPMISLGGPEIATLADGWTIVTRDGSLSAQFEHTVLVTNSGCEILTEYR